ncbi:MAG TPA: MFS transporter [Rhodocyclaceae bacterium]|jgi:predicted MFS family arabinose efflux permease|nr:MFS transporter [Rhodocyclaceae bacterium]
MMPSSPSPTTDRDLIRQIALLSFAAFAASGTARITDPLLPQLADAFAISAGQASQAVSAFALAYGAFQLLYGPLADRFGKYRVICYAMFASMLGSIGTAMATDFNWLVVTRVLTGATAAAAIPLSMAWIADNVSYEKRQPVLAYFLIGQIFGIISGQVFGGLFADLTGWRGAFWFMLFAFLIVGTLLQWERRRSPGVDRAAETDGPPVHFSTRFAAVIRTPWARVILIGVCFEGACVFGGLAFVPTYLHHTFGISLTKAGALMAMFGLGGLSYAMFAKHFVSRLGESGLAIAGGCTLGLSYVIFILAPHWLWAAPGAWCAGIGYYMMHNTFQINATQMTPAHRGTAVSMFASAFFLGQSSGVGLNSFTIDHLGFVAAFAIPAIALPVIGIVFATLLKRKHAHAAN